MANSAVHNLLTPDNCVVTFIDHQPQMLFGVANFDRQTIINNERASRNLKQKLGVKLPGFPLPDQVRGKFRGNDVSLGD